MVALIALMACTNTRPVDDPDPDPATEIDLDSDSDSNVDTDDPDVVVLRNHVEPCNDINLLRPGALEDGAWATARLSPDAWPFTVASVHVSVEHDVNGRACDSDGPFAMRVWSEDIAPPTAMPTVHVAADVVPSGTGAVRSLDLDLDVPLELTAGEHVYVAVQSSVVAGNITTCLRLCGDDQATARNYWSVDDAPHVWDAFMNVGVDSDLWAEARGR